MNMRWFLLLLFVAPLWLAVGCAAAPDSPTDDASPSAGEKPKVEVNSNPNVAPEPHAPGEGARFAPVARPWTDRPSKKPWSELILGKWLRAQPELVGQKVWEFTRGGKLNICYTYPAASNGNHPAGVERRIRHYCVTEDVLFPASTEDDGLTVTESTTYIKSLSENELVVYSISQVRWSLKVAKDEAAARKIPLQQALAEVASVDRSPDTMYVRLKNK